MCGRFTLHASPEELSQRFGIMPPADLKPRYNLSPSQLVFGVRETVGRREGAWLRWGLIPSWAKARKTNYSMINARAETVANKPAFRAAYRRRRCLIPADGFYEWKSSPTGKQPYYIRIDGGEVFGLAGLWEHWEGEGNVIESCTILVTAANGLMRSVHERMPVILDAEHYASWLDVERFDAVRLAALLQPFPEERMDMYPVSPQVNSPRNDHEGCIAPL